MAEAIPLRPQATRPTPAPSLQGRAFPIVVTGHVDHGKSTLVGRLLHETGSLPDGRVDELREASARRGLDFEWSFLLDALQVERDQGITVDTTQIWFSTRARRYVIIDAPGHKEFLKNMVTGAAGADAAVLVVDAVAGLSEQTRKHAYLLSLLGVAQVAVAVNKIDLAGFDEDRFDAVAVEVGQYLSGIGIDAARFIPVSARHGDNIAARSNRMPWYRGPILVEALDAFTVPPAPVDRPLRLPVQDLLREGDRRILLGRIDSGRIARGDLIRVHPGGREARVRSIETWSASGRTRHDAAAAGQSVALTLDEEVFVERGSLVTGTGDAPAGGHVVSARVFWLDKSPLLPGARVTVRFGTAAVEARVEAIDRVIDIDSGAAETRTEVARNGIAHIRLRTARPVALDLYRDNPRTGRATLTKGHVVMGGLIVDAVADAAAENLTAVPLSVTAAERRSRRGHGGGVLWLTGHSGAGKSTLAMRALRLLHDRGASVAVLDGDNLRTGLNRDLGFSDDDRRENIRRTAEVAKLMAETGQIVLVALISPRAADRAMAAGILGPAFREVHVHADIATCRARDPKGLYARADAGAIAGFTGVSAPYEAPADPALRIETAKTPAEAAAETLAAFALKTF